MKRQRIDDSNNEFKKLDAFSHILSHKPNSVFGLKIFLSLRLIDTMSYIYYLLTYMNVHCAYCVRCYMTQFSQNLGRMHVEEYSFLVFRRIFKNLR